MRGLSALGSIALAATLASCEEPVPQTPTFALDVKPIFAAHCVRCHGAGGTLNADPRAPDKNAPPDGYLDRYADKSDCTPDAAGDVPPTCERGALSEVK